jgi:predicted acylesterase/phospholipase RssA
MTPERVVLVLSGGGMKAAAHIGVVRAMEQVGMRPAAICAVSAGALVGALVAAGTPYERLVELFCGLRRSDMMAVNRASLVVRGVGAPSLLKPAPLQALLTRILPAGGFDAMLLPLRIGATDLDRGELVVFGSAGRADVALTEAVYASMALPLYLPPAVIGGRTYADGGLLQALPLELVTSEPADLVVAVDVGPAFRGRPDWRTQAPALVALHDRVLGVTMADQRRRTVEAWRADSRRPPLVLVEPAVDPSSTFSFDRTVDSIEAGYRAAHTALAARRAPPPAGAVRG